MYDPRDLLRTLAFTPNIMYGMMNMLITSALFKFVMKFGIIRIQVSFALNTFLKSRNKI